MPSAWLTMRSADTVTGTLMSDSPNRGMLPRSSLTPVANVGFLHAGTVVTLADTCAGYGCIVNLPDGATGFTTVELKSNHVGTTRDGTIDCTAKAVHLGRTTQVWDATVTHKESGRTLAVFRCTQMILYARKSV